MLVSRVARRYAEALHASVPPATGVGRFLDDVRDLLASIGASHELRRFFESPIIPEQRKTDAVRALFADRLDGYTLGALLFLVGKRREALLEEILHGIVEIDRRKRGVLAAQVASALPLDDDQRERVVDAVSRRIRSRIETEFRLAPDLLAGVVARVGDVVLDGSASRQLERLRRRFREA